MLELFSTCGCWASDTGKLSTGLYTFSTLLSSESTWGGDPRTGFQQRKFPSERDEGTSEIVDRTQQNLKPDSVNIVSQWEKTTEQLRNNNIANNSLFVTRTRYQDKVSPTVPSVEEFTESLDIWTSFQWLKRVRFASFAEYFSYWRQQVRNFILKCF